MDGACTTCFPNFRVAVPEKGCHVRLVEANGSTNPWKVDATRHIVQEKKVDPLSSSPPDFAGRTILLTGASGVIGQALLSAWPRSTVICLVHRTPIAGPNVVGLTGDISQPRLGLMGGEYTSLARRVDCIVHSAAVTSFNQSSEAIRQTNVAGTEHMLDLAARARVPFYHVSTAFVHPRGQAAGVPDADPYEASKREGECAVRKSGVPHVIIRPSIVIGDSRSGRIAHFQGLYLMVDLLTRGLLPVVPALPTARADFVPQDVVAEAITTLIAREVTRGEFWLTAGQDALSLPTVIDLCVDFMRRHGGISTAPRIVHPEVFERLVRPAFFPALPPRLRRTLGQAFHISRYFNIDGALPNSIPELRRDFALAPVPDAETCLWRSLEYWAAETGRSREPAPPLALVRGQKAEVLIA
jgi:nucleoside-diphosphate-sugar epimerase